MPPPHKQGQIPDELTFLDPLMRFVPLGNRRMVQQDTFQMNDLNGQRVEFSGEGFRTPYNTFVLICAESPVPPAVKLPRLVTARPAVRR
jgi:hypothetical protein